MSSDSGNAPPEDVFNIMIATDIHLGCHENDPIRGDDSFNTFDEILRLAVARDVDFILLGGDLFHDASPSPQCLHRCFTLLRRYCMGDKPISIQFVSDQAENFQHCMNPVVNYEDPNLNIAIPIFSIHGNHDDPSGFGQMSSLDLLSDTGLINYFGKWTDLTKITISPILLKKGSTKLALYGLSHIKDERLARLFNCHQVSMLRPKECTDEWFNLFVLHQNRANRGRNNYISESVLPDFLDLIVWGHEHECRIEPEFCKNFFITQPGSPVATSLCEGEAVEKYVGILKVYKKKFIMETIKLKTVRPFVMRTEDLSKYVCKSDKSVNEEIMNYLSGVVEEMLEKAAKQISGHKNQARLPLLRLRVEYKSDLHFFNVIRFGQHYIDRVANHMDMVKLAQEKDNTNKLPSSTLDKEAMEKVIENEEDPLGRRVETVLERYFTEEGKDRKLSILSVKGLGEAVSQFIDRGDKEAIDIIASHQINKTIKHLQGVEFKEDELELHLENYRESRMKKQEDDMVDARIVLENINRQGRRTNDSDMSDNSEPDTSIPETTVRGRGRGGRGRAANVNTSADTSVTKPARGRGSRGPRARANKTPVAQRTIATSFATQRTSQRSSKASFVISDSDSD